VKRWFRRWWGALLSALVLTLVAVPASPADTPTIDAPVTDLTQLLPKSAVDSLDAKLREHLEKHGVQIAVLLIRTTHGEPIEDYSIRVAKKWGGGSKKRDDGALIVLAIDDRRMRLELGYGLEERIPDFRAQAILDAARPRLREARFGDAVNVIVDGVIRETRAGHRAAALGPLSWWHVLGAYVLFPLLMAVGALFGERGRPALTPETRAFSSDRTRLRTSRVFRPGFVFAAAWLVVAACALGGHLGLGWCQGAAMYSGIAFGTKDPDRLRSSFGEVLGGSFVVACVAFCLNSAVWGVLTVFGIVDSWWIGLWLLSAFLVPISTFK